MKEKKSFAIPFKMNRRKFITVTSTATGAMLLQFKLTDAHSENIKVENSHNVFPNGWLTITPDNEFFFTLDKIELGQNVITSLVTLFAEEIDIHYKLINIIHPTLGSDETNPKYQPSWGTGGSSSVRTLWMPLRHAGAATKALFIAAAAKKWGTPVNQLVTHNGVITDPDTGRQLNFAQLIPDTLDLTMPDYRLKTTTEFSQIGKNITRYDAMEKVTGTQVYGIDASIKNQKFAALIHSPAIGAQVLHYSINKKELADKEYSVIKISNGIAVVAPTWWEAKNALKSITVEWSEGHNISSSDITVSVKSLAKKHVTSSRPKNKSTPTIEVSYSVPLLAHTPMETINCSCWFHDGFCEVWAPTQRPLQARQTASNTSGLPLEKIILHTCSIGGSFGRRLAQDYVVETVEIAQKIKEPVTLIWSREDDIRHGFFRPIAGAHFSATIDNKTARTEIYGHIISLTNQQIIKEQALPLTKKIIALFNNTKYYLKGKFLNSNDHDLITYAFEKIKLEHSELQTLVPVGAWRSVDNSFYAFFIESFIDELAIATQKDPVDFRLEFLNKNNKRLSATLNAAASIANWKQPSPKGHYRGVACYNCFSSYVAQIIEISVTKNKPIIEKIICVADAGIVVDPDGLKAQLEGAIIYGLSAALYGKIDVEHGKITQSNFHDYQAITFDQSPEIIIKLLKTNHPPGGGGEIGTPPVAPALANAWFAATGKRIRNLPLLE